MSIEYKAINGLNEDSLNKLIDISKRDLATKEDMQTAINNKTDSMQESVDIINKSLLKKYVFAKKSSQCSTSTPDTTITITDGTNATPYTMKNIYNSASSSYGIFFFGTPTYFSENIKTLNIKIKCDKNVKIALSILFGYNWAQGNYCTKYATLNAEEETIINIDLNNNELSTKLASDIKDDVSIALITAGLGVTNTNDTYTFEFSAYVNNKDIPDIPIRYSKYAELSNQSNLADEAKNSINAINAGISVISSDKILTKYKTTDREDIITGRIPLINLPYGKEFNKTTDMVCDHWYGFYFEIIFDKLKDLDKNFYFNIKYLEDNVTKFNQIAIVKTKNDWYPGNYPIYLTSDFKDGQGIVNLYEKIVNCDQVTNYSDVTKFYIVFGYYNGTTEDKYTDTSTHCTIFPYFEETGNVVLANKISDNIKQNLIDEIKNNSSNEIVCWGDSLTAMGGWTNKLAELSGMTVINAGVGGETSATIMARQGANCMLVNNITIPSDTTAVQIATRTEKIMTFNGKYALPLLQGGSSTINPCYIKGIKGTLSWTGSSYNDMTGVWNFTRTTAGEEVIINRPTPIITNYMKIKRTPKLMIIFIGQNGGWDTVESLIEQHKLMIDYANNPEYFVLGLSSGTATERAEYEKAMKNAFGRRFFSLREYLSQYGIDDLGLTPTDEDTAAMEEGKVPPQLLIDSVHYSTDTRSLIGKLIYDKLVELNIL